MKHLFIPQKPIKERRTISPDFQIKESQVKDSMRVRGNSKKIKSIVALLLLVGLTMFQSCKKGFNDEPVTNPQTPQTPQKEMVNQSFSLSIQTDVNQIGSKAWDANTWVYNYSPIPQVLKLTGTGASAGTNYSQTVTVADLKAGNISFNMFPGTYTAEFNTPHVQSSDVFSLNGNSVSGVARADAVGDVLDIDIYNQIVVTGTPIALTATLGDALVIVDIPSTAETDKYSTAALSGIPTRLIKFPAMSVQYGYIRPDLATWLKIQATDNSFKTASLGLLVTGKVYHITSTFGGQLLITIPGMTVNEIVLP
jgi:hypothetical protein